MHHARAWQHRVRGPLACALAAALAAPSQNVCAQDVSGAATSGTMSSADGPGVAEAEGPTSPSSGPPADGRGAAQAAGPEAMPGDEAPRSAEVANDSTPAERMAMGKALYARRQYVEAARMYARVETPGALYNAAMSRAAAGHDAHALLLWTRYLGVAPEDERAEVEESIAAAGRRTVAVQFARTNDADGPRTLTLRDVRHLAADELRIAWPEDQATLEVSLDPGRWTATLEGATDGPRSLTVVVAKGEKPRVDLAPEVAASPVRLRLNPARALRRGVTVMWSGPRAVAERRVTGNESSRWELARGRWRVTASAPGYEASERAVEVTERPVEMAIQLRLDRESRARLGVGVSLGVAALGLAAAGGALLADADQTADKIPNDPGHRLTSDEVALVSDLRRYHAAGFIVLSASAGTAVAALTGGLARGNKALATQAGLGFVLAVIGASSLGTTVARDELNKFPSEGGGDGLSRGDLDKGLERAAPWSVLTGVGLGLALPAVVALITRRSVNRQTRSRQAIAVSRDTIGVTIQGIF